jgi:hypothetical protein
VSSSVSLPATDSGENVVPALAAPVEIPKAARLPICERIADSTPESIVSEANMPLPASLVVPGSFTRFSPSLPRMWSIALL